MKVAACTAVMLQPLLSRAITVAPTVMTQRMIGILYNLVKFTAPVFIFGIFYTTQRTTWPQTLAAYPRYLQQQWHALFIPTIGWTTVYLLAIPSLQVQTPYHDAPSFIWQFINGNAAPHLWYNTMMLQFILLMPIFWALLHYLRTRRRLIVGLLLISSLYLGWLGIYDHWVWHGPKAQSWALMDRIFISFLPYAVLGGLAWQYRSPVNHWLKRWHRWLLIALGLTFIGINWELWQFGLPVKLSNAPYYQPSLTLYALLVISLIASIANQQQASHAKSLPVIHWLAIYAYRAYLANVFWLQCLWTWLRPHLRLHLGWVILLVYLLTWLLSFATAFSLHWLNQRAHDRLKNSHKQ